MVKKNGGKKNWGLKKNGHDKKNGGTGCQNTRKFPVFVSPWGGGTKKAKAKTQQV